MKSLGDDYEAQAARWLAERGLQLLQRNYRCKAGEIDLIALHDQTLVFVEVRARGNRRFAGAAASVDRRKQQRLLRTARFFLQRHPQWHDLPCRFDVLAFEPPQSGSGPAVRWIRSAFTA